uniref:Uncharacterized protein n=1 Tax=Anopheles albimanus TaxID=7167 RepID=A0A182FMI6_ANOAL
MGQIGGMLLAVVATIAVIGSEGQFLAFDQHATECALYVNGPGKSSAFDYNLNLFRGAIAPAVHADATTCITYDAINQAYLDARKRIRVSQPKGDWKTEDIATVGELLLDISIQLARTYGLSYEEIEKGLPNPRVPCKSGILPSIDLSKWADYGHETHSPHQYQFLNDIPETVGFK